MSVSNKDVCVPDATVASPPIMSEPRGIGVYLTEGEGLQTVVNLEVVSYCNRDQFWGVWKLHWDPDPPHPPFCSGEVSKRPVFDKNVANKVTNTCIQDKVFG